MDFSLDLTCIQDGFYCRYTNIKQQFTGKCFHAIIRAGVVNSGRRLVSSREEAILVTLYDFLSFIFLVTICIVALRT